ncbi:alpha-amylase family glycosyl hydrolase [Demequina sp. NBRC 110056]|uniref:alpha-amylase family glycosyl hydrolase n=1 Tax=Demequina sp. NBRC 110056 TaxID=1570345 RepID=UPI0009FF1FD4|nr:alpha-amylase family glycosyl hydrolase [Demequina sp. NBRC 110056]
MLSSPRTRIVAAGAAALAIAAIAIGWFLTTRPETPHAVAPARNAGSEQLLYFLLTDRFANGDPGNDDGGLGPDPAISGLDPTDSGYFQGGDLAGVEQRLDYLAGLGATGIWVTPPFTNKAVQPEDSSAGYHGYWITDFTEVDPHLGGTAALESLVAAAHERDMAVYLDIITNHTADVIGYEEGDRVPYVATDAAPYTDAGGEPFDDRAAAAAGDFPEVTTASFPYSPVLEAGAEDAKSPAWLNDLTHYHHRGNSTFTGEDSLYGDFYGLDDLWTEHPAVVEGMTDIYADWVATGIDGYRIDTVRHVDDGFWEAFVPAILKAAEEHGNDDFVIFGEVYDGSRSVTSRFTTEVGMPAVLDFPFQGAARAFASDGGSATDLAAFFDADDWYTDADSSAADLPTFLGNHDMGRFGSMLLEDDPSATAEELLARDRLAHALLLTSRGTPVIYYGDEQGLTGDGGDKAARQPLFGTSIPEYTDDALIGSSASLADEAYGQDHPLYTWIAELSRVAHDSAALTTGAHQTRLAEDGAGVYAFTRMDRDERVETLVALNSAAEPRTVDVPTWSRGTFSLLAGDGDATLQTDDAGVVTLTVPAYGAVVYGADAPITERSDASVSLAAGWDAAGPDDEVDLGRLPVRAEVTGDGYAEVSFWARTVGGDWEHLGTDDAAPFQVYDVVTDLAPGAAVEYQAVVSDGRDTLATSDAVTAQVPEPTVTIASPAPGDTLGVEPLIVAAVSPVRVDAATTTVTIERRLPGGDWETVVVDTSSSAYAGVDDLGAVTAGSEVQYRATLTQGDATVVSSVVAAKAGGARGAGTPSVPGSFNDVVGCAEVWQPDCEAVVMTFDEAAGAWTLTVDLPAGEHEYKIAIDGSWDENYGEGGAADGRNIVLALGADASVTFTYDPVTHVVSTEAG